MTWLDRSIRAACNDFSEVCETAEKKWKSFRQVARTGRPDPEPTPTCNVARRVKLDLGVVLRIAQG